MNILEKIKQFFKGVGIFFVMYVVISGNGDDTFFAWILMFVSLVMTILFLDESTNKAALVVTTILLSAVCSRGFVEAVPFLLIILVIGTLFYIFGCSKDFQIFKNKLEVIFYGEKTVTHKKQMIRTVQRKEWRAWNIFHPLERYAYSEEQKCFIVKNGFPPFFGREKKYPLSEVVHLEMMEVKWSVLWCKILIPVKYNANSHTPTVIVFSNIRRKKYHELMRDLPI